VRRFAWIITVPVTIVVVVFAVSNRDFVTLDLWPFELTYSMPLFALVLICLVVGFLLGAFIMWISSGKTRSRAREAYYKASSLERDLAFMKRKQAEAAEQPPGQPSNRPAGPALPASSARR
jgi:uncharacterized integral membrane protein